jgi:hypothetical protein
MGGSSSWSPHAEFPSSIASDDESFIGGDGNSSNHSTITGI